MQRPHIPCIQRIYASLEALRTAMDDLKTKSQESFGVTHDIRTSLAEVQDLRHSVTTAMKRGLRGLVGKLHADDWSFRHRALSRTQRTMVEVRPGEECHGHP